MSGAAGCGGVVLATGHSRDRPGDQDPVVECAEGEQRGDNTHHIQKRVKIRCEGDLAATSVTPLITRVDSADLAGEAGVPFLPH